MNGEFIQMIEDTRAELDSIRKWINAGNQFDSKTRYLISYAVVKASGAVEVIFKNMIYNYLIHLTHALLFYTNLAYSYNKDLVYYLHQNH